MSRPRLVSGAVLLILLLGLSSPAAPRALSSAPISLPTPTPLGLLQTGDLVFRRVSGPVSQFVDAIDSESRYSHVGIIYVTPEGQPSVIHVLPRDPDVTQLEPIDRFLAEAKAFAVYHPVDDLAEIASVAAQKALAWVGQVRFDKALSLQTDETLYCTELVYKAYLEAGVDIVKGEFDIVELLWLDEKEVIVPSRFMDSGYFLPVYESIYKDMR